MTRWRILVAVVAISSWLPCGYAANDYAGAVRDGDEKMAARDFAGARVDYQQAVELAPANGEKLVALNHVADTYRNENDLESAKRIYATAAGLPDIAADLRMEEQINMAGMCTGLQDYEGAQKLLAQVATAPDGANPAYKVKGTRLLAFLYLSNQQKYAQARETFASLLAMPEAQPDEKAEALIQISSCAQALKDLEGAKAALAQLLAMPEQINVAYRIDAQERLASFKADAKDYAGAHADLLKALALTGINADQQADILMRNATLYFYEKNLDAVKAELAKLIALPGVSPDWLARGHQTLADWCQAGDPAAMRTELEKSLAVDKLSPYLKADMLQRIIASYRAEKNYAKAREVAGQLATDATVPPDNRSQARLLQGEMIEQEGTDSAAARAAYEQALAVPDISPYQRFNAMMHIGNSLAAEQKLDEAHATFIKTAALPGIAPDWAIQAQDSAAQMLVRQDNPAAAAAELQKSLDTKGIAPDAKANVLKRLVDLAMGHRDFATATALLNQALAMEGISPGQVADLHQRQGEVCINQTKYPEARAELAKVAAMPDISDEQKGNALWRISDVTWAYQHDAAATKEVVDQLLALKGANNDQRINAISRRAEVLMAGKDLAGAQQALASGLSLPDLRPDLQASLCQRLGDLALATQDLAGARDQYAKGLAVPKLGWNSQWDLQMRLVNCAMSAKDFTAAKAICKAASAIPGLPVDQQVQLQCRVADVLQAENNPDGALAALQQAAATTGAVTFWIMMDAHNRIANMLSQQNKHAEARTELAKNLTLKGIDDNNLANVYATIAETYVREQQYPAARGEENKALALTHLAPYYQVDAYLRLAGIYEAEQNRNEARAAYLKALAVPDAPVDRLRETQMKLANTYAVDQDVQNAKAEYRKVLDLKDLPPEWKAQADKYLDDHKNDK